MIKITFFEVGHGDSIIIEWDDQKKKKIAIIDCNEKRNKENPIIDYLKESSYDSIEFMILTHPHTDHFSGFTELLNFCAKRKITVNRFYHTAQFHRDLLKSVFSKDIDNEVYVASVNGSLEKIGDPKNMLYNFFELLHNLHFDKKSILTKVCSIDDEYERELSNELKLKVLAPSLYNDVLEYLQKTAHIISKKIHFNENNPDANALSTVILIYTENWYLLLTSDVQKEVLDRIEENYRSIFKKNLATIQIPHHGSLVNHNPVFWLNRKNGDNIPAVVSVGNKYNLPSKKVIRFFDTYYNFFTTNTTSNLQKYYNQRRMEVLLNTIDFTDNCNDQIKLESRNIVIEIDKKGIYKIN